MAGDPRDNDAGVDRNPVRSLAGLTVDLSPADISAVFVGAGDIAKCDGPGTPGAELTADCSTESWVWFSPPATTCTKRALCRNSRAATRPPGAGTNGARGHRPAITTTRRQVRPATSMHFGELRGRPGSATTAWRGVVARRVVEQHHPGRHRLIAIRMAAPGSRVQFR